MLATIVVYIIDLSGFTQSWRDALARWLKVQSLRPLPPFDCGKCAVFWATLIYCIATGTLSLPMLLACALLSHLSLLIGQILILINELLLLVIRKIGEVVR